MFRSVVRFVGAFGAASAFLAVLVELTSCATWSLSGAGRQDVDELARSRWQWRPDLDSPNHKVREWAGPRSFGQAPMLDDAVRQGALPPVEQRLPENPLVIEPPQQIGPYGGLWTRYVERPNHIYIANYYIANNSLLRWNPRGDGIQLNMAAEWPTVEDDGRAFVFKLRRGVRWSDGQPFTADDLVFWFEDVLKNPDLTPTMPAHWKHGGEVARLEKIDDYTVRFRFAQPHGLFIKAMTHVLDAHMLDHPAHYLRQFHVKYAEPARIQQMLADRKMGKWHELFLDRWDWRNPECPRLSPWVIKQRPDAAGQALYERNTYYWKVDPDGNQLPYIDRIEYKTYEPEMINFMIIAGKFGFRNGRLEDLPLYARRGPIEGYSPLWWMGSHGNGYVLAFNLNHPDPVLREIFNKKEFRMAMSHAINRREVIDIGGGLGVPRQVCPPRASPYFSEEVKKYEQAYTEYNPELSRRLLEQIGLKRRNRDGILLRPDGKPLRIWLETSRLGNAHELICEYFTRVGVKTDLKLEARDLFYQRKAAMMHDVAMWVGADEFMPMLDPRWFFPLNDESLHAIAWARWFQSQGERGDQPPPEVLRCMELYRGMASTVDDQEQRRLFDEIVRLNRENLWVIGLSGDGPSLMLVKDSFRNVPQLCIVGSAWRTPGNAAPECWSIQEGPAR